MIFYLKIKKPIKNLIITLCLLFNSKCHAKVYTIGDFSSLVNYAWPVFEYSHSTYLGRMQTEDILYVNLYNISFIDVIDVYKEINNGNTLLLDMSDIESSEKRIIMSQQLIKLGVDAPLIAFNKNNTDSNFYNIAISREDTRHIIRKSISFVLSKVSESRGNND